MTRVWVRTIPVGIHEPHGPKPRNEGTDGLSPAARPWWLADENGILSRATPDCSFLTESRPMLLLKDVKKSYSQPDGNPLPVLDIAEFRLGKGEQSVLLGESGSGKSTLLNVIAGISLPDSGLVEIDGIDITKLPEAGRDLFRADKIGFVFQQFNLLPGFTALENVSVAMGFATGHADESRARELLERVGLGKRMTHRPSHLSVGEQQRVGVARALANRPKLLLADEPTASVDPKHQQQILELIRETCHEQDVALLLVTHSPHVAEQYDRVERLEEFNTVVEV